MIKTVLFDLFDTLVFFHYSKLPTVEVNGKAENSTVGEVYKVYNEHFPFIPFSKFYLIFKESHKIFLSLKLTKHKEYNSSVRFNILLDLLKIKDTQSNKQKIVSKMVCAHMESLLKAVSFPSKHLALLKYLKKKGYNLGLVSNFDHAPTARKLLHRYNINRYFNTIVISDEVGWRKPHSAIFEIALNNIGAKKNEAIFVGDDYDADIRGALKVGLRAVWMAARTKSFEKHKRSGNVIKIDSLDELTSIL